MLLIGFSRLLDFSSFYGVFTVICVSVVATISWRIKDLYNYKSDMCIKSYFSVDFFGGHAACRPPSWNIGGTCPPHPPQLPPTYADEYFARWRSALIAWLHSNHDQQQWSAIVNDYLVRTKNLLQFSNMFMLLACTPRLLQSVIQNTTALRIHQKCIYR